MRTQPQHLVGDRIWWFRFDTPFLYQTCPKGRPARQARPKFDLEISGNMAYSHGLTTYCAQRMDLVTSRSRATARANPVSYTHLRAHETDSYIVCRLLLEKKK